jgi:hypothetical protein
MGAREMPAEMGHYMKDLYPNQGFNSTYGLTQPEAEDQVAMVDDQKTAEANVQVDPAKNKGIWMALLITVALIIGLSIVF